MPQKLKAMKGKGGPFLLSLVAIVLYKASASILDEIVKSLFTCHCEEQSGCEA